MLANWEDLVVPEGPAVHVASKVRNYKSIDELKKKKLFLQVYAHMHTYIHVMCKT